MGFVLQRGMHLRSCPLAEFPRQGNAKLLPYNNELIPLFDKTHKLTSVSFGRLTSSSVTIYFKQASSSSFFFFFNPSHRFLMRSCLPLKKMKVNVSI